MNWNEYLREKNITEAMIALVIANTTLMMGAIILQLISASFYLVPSLTDIDISLVSIILTWFTLLESGPAGIGLLVFSWIIAGVIIKINYGDIVGETLFKASLLPFLFFYTLFVLFALILVVGLGLVSFTIFLGIFLIGIYILILNSLIVAAGVIISQFVSFDKRYEYRIESESEFLTLKTIPQDEKPKACPFKMNERPGCSYLGYEAPDLPLICDYESTYLRCTIYSHIYNTIFGDELED